MRGVLRPAIPLALAVLLLFPSLATASLDDTVVACSAYAFYGNDLDGCRDDVLGLPAAPSSWSSATSQAAVRVVKGLGAPVVLAGGDGSTFVGGDLFTATETPTCASSTLGEKLGALACPVLAAPRVGADGADNPHVLHATPRGGLIIERWDPAPPGVPCVAPQWPEAPGCWMPVSVGFPAGVSALGDPRVEFAVDASGRDYVLLFGNDGHLHFGEGRGGISWLADLGPVPSRVYALAASGPNAAYGYYAATIGALSFHILVDGAEISAPYVGAAGTTALALAASPAAIDAAWARGGTIAFTRIVTKDLRRPLLLDDFVASYPLDPYSFTTNEIYEPTGRPGAFVEAGGLETADNAEDAYMAYAHPFDPLPSAAVLTAETRVSAVSNDAIGVGFALANGSYAAAMVTNDTSGTEPYGEIGSRLDGIELVPPSATKAPVARWARGAAPGEFADPQKGPVSLTLVSDPVGGLAMKVNGAVVVRAAAPSSPVVGVAILSFYQDNVARADFLYVYETPPPDPETIASTNGPIAPARLAVAEDATGEVVAAWSDASGLVQSVIKRDAHWTPTTPIGTGGPVTGLALTSVLVDPTRNASEFWLGVGTRLGVAAAGAVSPGLDASAVLYRSERVANAIVWGAFPLGAGTSLVGPSPSLVALGAERLAAVWRGDDMLAATYWERGEPPFLSEVDP